MFIPLGLVALLLFLIISAWISAAEIGITSLSNYKVKKLIAQKPRLSNSLLSWLKSPHYLLTVILTINIIFDMLTSFLATAVMASAFHMLNRYAVEAVSWIVTSFTLLIFGEIVPKFYARLNPERITVMSVPILSNIGKISKPFLYPIIKITEMLSPKISSANSFELSKEEVENLLSDGGYSGEIDKHTTVMLRCAFNFKNLSVKEIMTEFKDIESIDLSLEEEDFLDRAVETSRSRIPIYIKSKDNIIGYIHIKDILKLWQENKGRFIRSMIKEPYYVDEYKKMEDLLREFKSGKTHIAFVKDKSGNIIGMITLEDILEKVVGNILDEYELKK
jgi:CBS domain containing-hemolysin-like protein